jgi:hypothetical protein
MPPELSSLAPPSLSSPLPGPLSPGVVVIVLEPASSLVPAPSLPASDPEDPLLPEQAIKRIAKGAVVEAPRIATPVPARRRTAQ